MSVKRIWVPVIVLSGLLLVGCGWSGTYVAHSLSKHPVVLELNNDGGYGLEHMFTDDPVEAGRWWVVEDGKHGVVILLPDDEAIPEHFARISKKHWPRLVLTETFREALPDVDSAGATIGK
ncbi:MAG: hypothetical protein CMJ49_13155 [Planctomycetaceae bacterium]|nr:hypothetical protein [Planctomycetaceae bacterium]